MSRFRIQRFKAAVTVTPGTGVTTAAFTVGTLGDTAINGLLRQVNVQTPAAVDGSATMSVQLLDADGFKIYDNTATQAVNTKTPYLLTNPVPLANIATVQVTFSAAQTATASTTNVSLLIERQS